MEIIIKILDWNVGGAKYLQEKEGKREEIKDNINNGLKKLIVDYKPHIITLQEIVRYGKSNEEFEEIIETPQGYKYWSFPLIDSDRLSSKSKWSKVKKTGGWDSDTFFAQGNAILYQSNIVNFPIWNLSKSCEKRPDDERHFIEQINLESGLYFGDRNTEPRAALVSHFICDFTNNKGVKNKKPLDVFVINIHLTTLVMEREGIPEIDMEATRVRLNQLEIIFRGIISRYNVWKQQGFKERGEKRKMENDETSTRCQPVWIIAGDFNFTEESEEYHQIKRMNFIDTIENKGLGTKAKGVGNDATLTLDYIFAGPRFISLDPLVTERGIKQSRVIDHIKASDHLPIIAKIPILIPD